MDKIELRETRLRNLNWLIEKKFNGSQTDFSKAARKNATQVNHWISGHRNPNGDTCRDVERELKLAEGWMDRDHRVDDVTQTPTDTSNSAQVTTLVPNPTGMPGKGVDLIALVDVIEAADDLTRMQLKPLLCALCDEPSRAREILSRILGAGLGKRQQRTRGPATIYPFRRRLTIPQNGDTTTLKQETI